MSTWAIETNAKLLAGLEMFNYGLVLIYGLFLSVDIAGGWKSRRQQGLIFALCPAFILLQGICTILIGTEGVRQFYPALVHLPLVLILVFVLKKPTGVALVSVCTAYLCCQMPRWVKLAAIALTGSPLTGEISYALFIFPIFYLLRRYFVRAAHDTMSQSLQSLLLFGSLPLAYYFFDYATAVYPDVLHVDIQALNEFLPTALIVFYVFFLTTYYVLVQKRAQAELQSTMLEAELKQSKVEIESLRRMETKIAIYQHDMRHHLTMIEGFLTADKAQQAEEYIRKVRSDVEEITPKHFCGNETINLICSAFFEQAEQNGIHLKIEAKLPKELPVSDTEICSILSNGLENALHAASLLEDSGRRVSLYCGVQFNKLLIEIKNNYIGEIIMQDGLPVSAQEGHGYGCKSIRTIAERHRGLCTFEAENGNFILRVILPMYTKSDIEV